MNIKTYLDNVKKLDLTPQKPKSPSFYDVTLQTTDIWSNTACNGYALTAAKRAGFTEEQTEKLLTALSRVYDEIEVDEAEKIYNNSGYLF